LHIIKIRCNQVSSATSWRVEQVVDTDLILAKAGSIKKHLNRVFEKRETDLRTFLKDIDRQESILFNIQMAVQNCIDIAAHIISDQGLGVPGSTNEMFYLLEENGYLDNEITEKMVKAVGLRNLIVHEYSKIDLDQIFEVAQKDITDLNEYLKSIFKKLDLADK
jgi:uncharacterized protein YutE (UPF0331/DUF86 family)